MTSITRKRLVTDSVWSIASAIIDSVFAIACGIIIGNKWGKEGLGVFALCFSIYLLTSIICNIGIHNAVIYEVAAAGNDKHRASSFVYTALTDSLLLGLAAGLLGFVFADNIAAIFKSSPTSAAGQPNLLPDMLKLMLLAMPLFLINKTAIGIFNASRRMSLIAAATLLRETVIVVYFLAAALKNASLAVIPYAFILAEASIAVLLLAACFKIHKLAAPSIQKSKQLLAFGWKAGLSNVIGDINTRIDILILAIFCTEGIVGVYSAASTIAKGLWVVPSAIQRVVNPLLVQLHSTNQKEKMHRTIDVLLRLGTFSFILIGLTILVYFKPLITIAFPKEPEMIDAAIPFQFLLPGILLFSGLTMVGTAASASIGMPLNALKITSLVFVSNTIMNFLLIPSYGAAGAACATTLSLLFAIVYFYHQFKKYLDFHMPLLKLFVLLVSVCVLTFLSGRYENTIPRFLFLLIAAAAVTLLAFSMQFIHKGDVQTIRSVFKSIKTAPPRLPIE